MSRQTRQADEVQEGDLVFFPGSRLPLPVIGREDADDVHIALHAERSRWLVPKTFSVDVEVEDTPE